MERPCGAAERNLTHEHHNLITGVTKTRPRSVGRRGSGRRHGDRQWYFHRSPGYGAQRRLAGHGLRGVGGGWADVALRSADLRRALRGHAWRGRRICLLTRSLRTAVELHLRLDADVGRQEWFG